MISTNFPKVGQATSLRTVTLHQQMKQLCEGHRGKKAQLQATRQDGLWGPAGHVAQLTRRDPTVASVSKHFMLGSCWTKSQKENHSSRRCNLHSGTAIHTDRVQKTTASTCTGHSLGSRKQNQWHAINRNKRPRSAAWISPCTSKHLFECSVTARLLQESQTPKNPSPL